MRLIEGERYEGALIEIADVGCLEGGDCLTWHGEEGSAEWCPSCTALAVLFAEATGLAPRAAGEIRSDDGPLERAERALRP